jgi:hypothetical protein
MKVSSIKFHGNLSSGSRADTCGRTDGREEGNRLFFATMRTRKKKLRLYTRLANSMNV